MSKPKPILCQCGEEMNVYQTHTLCPHCDMSPVHASCTLCRRYQYWIQIRVTNEHTAERKRKKETGSW